MSEREEWEADQWRELQGRLAQAMQGHYSGLSYSAHWYEAQAARWWFAAYLRERAETHDRVARSEIGTEAEVVAARVLTRLADEFDADKRAMDAKERERLIAELRGDR